MASSGSAVVTLPEDNQILITREFDAPKELVWKAWTTPELIKQWWAGKRGDVTSVDVDLQVGGSWRYVMVAHGGFEVAFHGTYHEIVPNERMVSTEVFEMPDVAPEDAEAAASTNTLTLTESNGRTTLTVLVEHVKPEHRDAHIESGMEGGMQESMDALEQVAISLA